MLCRKTATSFAHSALFAWTSLLFCTVLSYDTASAGFVNQPFVCLYGAVGTDGDIDEMPGVQNDFIDCYMLSLMGGTAFYRYEDYFDLEAEAQVSNHFNEDSYWEFVAGLAFRWRYFPWGNTVATSLAVGTGLSFATKEPQLEIDKNGDTRRVLGYLMIELAVRPTPRSPWQIFGRLHHRSGLFGLFDDVQGGSNFYGIGIRYDF